jgi:hypothetical protein
MTRRVVKCPHLTSANEYDEYFGSGTMEEFDAVWYDTPKSSVRLAANCPYGQQGDRLWVKETFFDNCPGYGPEKSQLFYRADGVPDFEGEESEIRWTPSIHMPRWASRLTLAITEIRVERLQEISPDDCQREGTFYRGHQVSFGGREVDDKTYARAFRQSNDAGIREAFSELWDALNAKTCPWSSNPWVWVIGFRRVEE